MNFDFPALAARGRRFVAVMAGAVLSLLAVSQAHALPAFSAQTGASCAACHVGGFGPELTSFGRAFKIGGYTMGKTKNPVSAMAIASWIHTGADQPGGAAPHYSANNNLTLDEASLFLAGGNLGLEARW